MTASIAEISRNANHAAQIASEAAAQTSTATATVNELLQASGQIGEVAKMIATIAGQTNLLALNATIEAARAGEAGRGFAIVANEVKELAKATTQAITTIDGHVLGIGTSAARVDEAIRSISQVIGQINDAQSTIAAAVEEQTATAAEISRNVGEVATGSNEIAANIAGVAQAAGQTAEGTASTMGAAGELAHVAANLKDLVAQFRC